MSFSVYAAIMKNYSKSSYKVVVQSQVIKLSLMNSITRQGIVHATETILHMRTV